MKIKVDGPSGGIRAAIEERLRWQGEELTTNGDGETFRVSTFVGVPLADLTTEAVFGSVPQDRSPEPYNLIKIFDGENFKNQTILQIPFVGSNSEGLGFPCEMGSALKFVKKPLWQEDDKLRSFLKEMSFKGFVTLECNGAAVQRLLLGVPCFGAFGLIERWPGSLIEFDQLDDSFTLRESWSIATVIAAWPFPYNDGESQSGVRVNEIGDDILRHFWPFAKSSVKNGSFTSVDCVVGVATAWDQGTGGLQRMVDRLMWTCSNIKIPMKMHRTDLLATIRRKMTKIEEFIL